MNEQMARQIINMALQSKPCMSNNVFANAVNLFQQGKSQELWQLVDNVCKSKGKNKEEVRKDIGV